MTKLAGERTIPVRSEAVVEIQEHAALADVALSPEEARELDRSPAQIAVRPMSRPGHYELRASSVVGTVVLRSRVVRIRPKVTVGRLVWMLDVVGRVPELTAPVDLDEDQDLLAAVQQQYAALLERALAVGMVRDYVTVREDLQGLRGAPDFMEVITRRFGIFPPVRCRFDEFSADTTPNQILRAAAIMLGRWRATPHGRKLLSLASRMEGVRDVRYGLDRVPDPVLDRRYAPALPALRMAQVVLRRGSFEVRDGHLRAMSFLVDMDRLYEEFVVEALRRTLGLSSVEFVAQAPRVYLDLDRALRLRPDALWKSRDRRPFLVLDAKYKRDDETARADVYQMVAYMAALGVARGVLVHADVGSHEYRLVHGPRLLAVRLGLEGSAMEVARSVVEVARRITEFAGVPGHPIDERALVAAA